MKSLADLQKLRDQAKKKLDLRESETDYRVVVGMATCGIAAGARPVLNALVDEVAGKALFLYGYTDGLYRDVYLGADR